MSFTVIILAAAKKIGVSGSLLLAICTHESGLNNIYIHHDGGSPTYGICQIKYDTAKMIGFTGPAEDLMIAETNAEWAAAYLKYQKERYDGDWVKSTAAYNSGTYFESKKTPGCPKNLQYVKYVQKKLDEKLQDKLVCNTIKAEVSNENWENRNGINDLSTENKSVGSPWILLRKRTMRMPYLWSNHILFYMDGR